MRLKEVQKDVNELLITNPKTRENENELIYQYLKKKGMSTDYADLREINVSLAESICRARRKCVELNPSLDAPEKIRKRRETREQEYREMMRGV